MAQRETGLGFSIKASTEPLEWSCRNTDKALNCHDDSRGSRQVVQRKGPNAHLL